MNTYFDNAATSRPKPACVGDAMAHALLQAGNPGRGGHRAAMLAANILWDTREALADFFGCDNPQNVIFTANCTESINCVLHGILSRTGHAVVSDVEHNAVMRPLTEWRIPYTVAETFPNDPAATVAAFEAAIRPDTRLIVCTHASNVTGEIQPIRALARMAHSHNLPLAVDAAQTAGTVPISLKADGVDFLCMPGHKGLLGPSGTGVLISSQKIPLIPLKAGGTGSASLLLRQPSEWPERMESGTPNLPGIAGLGAAVRWLRPRQRALAEHEWQVAGRLWDGLASIRGVTLYSARPSPDRVVPLVLFSVAGETPEQTAERLAERGWAVRAGLHCAPAAHRKLGTSHVGAVRASVGFTTTLADATAFCRAVAERR